METSNHVKNGSFRNSKLSRLYRAKEAEYFSQGKFAEAFEMGIIDARQLLESTGGDLLKYEKGIKQARTHFYKEILPQLQEAYKK